MGTLAPPSPARRPSRRLPGRLPGHVPGPLTALMTLAVLAALCCALPEALAHGLSAHGLSAHGLSAHGPAGDGARDAGAPYWARTAALAGLYALCAQAPRFAASGARVPQGMSTFHPVPLAGALLLPPLQAALVVVPAALLAGEEARAGGARHLWRPARLAIACAVASATAGATAASWPAAPFQAGPGPGAALPAAFLPALVAALAFAAVLTALDATLPAAPPDPAGVSCGRPVSGEFLAAVVHGCAALTMALLWRSRYGPLAAVPALLPMYLSCWVFALYRGEHAARRATLDALVRAVDLKDRYTRGHGQRVGQAAAMIAQELGASRARAEELRLAGLLHDLGKLAVPTRVLRKQGPLTEEERHLVCRHPEYGHALVRDLTFLDEARAAILHHHERYDGGGYPLRLAGRHIPEAARVVAVADAFDAMTSTRSYSRARPVEVALAELERCAGSHFDPAVVGAFRRALDREGWQPVVQENPEPLPPRPPPQKSPPQEPPAPLRPTELTPRSEP